MNLEQVARRAKVSTATVSRVLNNASVVKTSTRSRVMKAVEELRYHPNLHARSLAGGKSKTIGVIVSNLENPFFFDIYKTIEHDAHARGYEVVMANTDYRPEQLVASVRLMIGRRVAGLAAVVSEVDPSLIEELTESRIPVVFYDVGAPRKNITNIRVNYGRGNFEVAYHDIGDIFLERSLRWQFRGKSPLAAADQVHSGMLGRKSFWWASERVAFKCFKRLFHRGTIE